MRRTALLLTIAAGFLAACATTGAGGADPTMPAGTPGSASAGSGDEPVASDMVRPVGGDLRIGQQWHLVGTFLGSVVMPEGLTITFDEKSVFGPGPVNSWFADYTASAEGSLTLGAMASTAMASTDEALNRAESVYFALLGAVDGYTAVEGGELYLFDGQANTLVYSVDPPADDPLVISEETQALAQEVVGLSEAPAKATVEAAGHTFRVVARDGESLAVTDDYSTTRINVTVENGTVTEATVG